MAVENIGLKAMTRFEDISIYSKSYFCSSDLFRFCIGNFLGGGAFRSVYDFPLIPNTVIKVCNDLHFANVVEWEIWQKAKDQKYRKWFAPCLYISPEGRFLIQRKVKTLPDNFKQKMKLPQFFTDIKMDNFGLIGKQVVCHDYHLLTRGLDYSMMANRDVDFQKIIPHQIDQFQ